MTLMDRIDCRRRAQHILFRRSKQQKSPFNPHPCEMTWHEMNAKKIARFYCSIEKFPDSEWKPKAIAFEQNAYKWESLWSLHLLNMQFIMEFAACSTWPQRTWSNECWTKHACTLCRPSCWCLFDVFHSGISVTHSALSQKQQHN